VHIRRVIHIASIVLLSVAAVLAGIANITEINVGPDWVQSLRSGGRTRPITSATIQGGQICIFKVTEETLYADPSHNWRLAGFSYWRLSMGIGSECGSGHSRAVYTDPISIVSIPLWSVSILFAIYPIVAFIRSPARRRRYRRKHGLCVKCGYNLTGLSESRCPECATEFER